MLCNPFLLVAILPVLLVSGRPCDEPHTTHRVHHTHKTSKPHTTRPHGPHHTTHHAHTTWSPARPPPTSAPYTPTPTPTYVPTQPTAPSGNPQGGSGNYDQCNTGPIHCCNSVEPAGSPSASTLLGSLGVVLADINTPIGLTCTPITASGLGSGANWSVVILLTQYAVALKFHCQRIHASVLREQQLQ